MEIQVAGLFLNPSGFISGPQFALAEPVLQEMSLGCTRSSKKASALLSILVGLLLALLLSLFSCILGGVGRHSALRDPGVTLASSELKNSSSVTLLQKPRTDFLLNEPSKQIVDRLRALRLDKFIQLPAIVVVGDTSSGKSSLLTAISGMQFPSNTGLTTRCPTEVILSYSRSRYAEVKLQSFKGMTEEQLHFHRVLTEDWSNFGGVITEATRLLTDGHDDSFITPNGIVVSVTGPDLPDLTLIDLPGLVSAISQDESTEIIAGVRSMIDHNIRSSRAIILCVVPANNDFHNSAILTMAKNADTEGVRTLGVVTKPDIVDRGAENEVLKLAANEKARLELGWHVVRLRSQEDLARKTIDEAEDEETRFFDTEPWCQLDKDGVGIVQLRSRLQELLQRRVHSELPAVLDEARQRLRHDEAALSKLGTKCESLAMKRQLFASYVRQCSELLKDAIDGRYVGDFFDQARPPFSNNLRAKIFELEQKFKANISKTRFISIGEYSIGDQVIYKGLPNIDRAERVHVPALIAAKPKMGEYTLTITRVDGSTFPANITSASEYALGQEIMVSISSSDYYIDQHYGDDNQTRVGMPAVVLAKSQGGSFTIKISRQGGSDIIKTNVPAEQLLPDHAALLEVLRHMRGDALPGFESNTIFRSEISQKLALWSQPSDELRTGIVKLLHDLAIRVVDFVVPSSLSSLRMYLKGTLIHDAIQQAATNTEIRTQEILHRERERPYTQNQYYSDTLNKMRNQQLKDRLLRLSNADGKIDTDAMLALLSSFGVGDQEIETAEAVDLEFRLAAYLKVASKRFIDEMPQVINTILVLSVLELVRKSPSQVPDLHLEKFVAEDGRVAQKRAELEESTKVLRDAVTFLQEQSYT